MYDVQESLCEKIAAKIAHDDSGGTGVLSARQSICMLTGRSWQPRWPAGAQLKQYYSLSDQQFWTNLFCWWGHVKHICPTEATTHRLLSSLGADLLARTALHSVHAISIVLQSIDVLFVTTLAPCQSYVVQDTCNWCWLATYVRLLLQHAVYAVYMLSVLHLSSICWCCH